MPVIETTNQPVVVEATGVPEVVEFTENQVTIEAPVTQVTVDFPGSARLIAGEGLEGGGLMQGDVDISLSAAALASLASADSAVQPGDDVSDLTNDADYQSGAQVTAAINALGTVYQPLDADLSAVAALSSLGLVARTAAGTFATRTLTGVTNQTDVTNGNGFAGNPTVGLAAAVLASLALANSAVQPGGPVSDFTNDVGYQTYGQVLVLISSAGAGYQPLDSDLTAIAALGTTSFGRGLLTLADAAATKALLDLEIGTDLQAYSSNLDLWSALAPSAKQDVSAKLTAYAGGDTPSAFTLGIVDSADAAAWRTALSVYSTTQVDTAIAGVVSDVAAGYQPLDADLTAIAALTTTTFGRSLLTLADAAAVRAVLDLEVGTDVQAYSAVLDAYAATTPDAYSLDLLSLDSAGAWRAAIGAGVPYTANALTRTNDTNITLTLGGTPATALLQAVSMTLGWTGTLAKDRGGFGEDASALTTTIAELNYVDGVTSNIQTQLDAKQAHSTVLDDWALGPSPSAFTLSLVNLTNASDWWVAIGAGVPTYDAGSGLDFTAGIFSIDYTYTGYWQAPIGFDNQDTATVDEIFWAMRVVDDPGVWSFYAQSDDGSTRANFLAVTRGTGVSIASMTYGNATDMPHHTSYGQWTWQGAGGSGGHIGYGTGDNYIDGGTTYFRDRTSYRVLLAVANSNLIYGNSTDNPVHTMYGRVEVVSDRHQMSYAGTAYMSYRMARSGGTTADWEMYIPSGSSDLRFFAAIDRLIITAAGAVTVPGTFFVTGNSNFTGYVLSKGDARQTLTGNAGVVIGNHGGVPTDLSLVTFSTPSGATNEKNTWVYSQGSLQHFVMTFVDDANSTTRDFLIVTRSGYAVATMSYGNAVDAPSHRFYGPVRIDHNPTYPQFHVMSTTTWALARLQNTGALGAIMEFFPASGENWNIIGYLSYFELGSAVSGRGAWRANATSGAITSISYGNSSDYPTHSFVGQSGGSTLTLVSNGTTYLSVQRQTQTAGQVALHLQTLSGSVNWVVGLASSSDDLRFYAASLGHDALAIYSTGALQMQINVWHVSRDGSQRMYFANSGITYLGTGASSSLGWVFQRGGTDQAAVRYDGYFMSPGMLNLANTRQFVFNAGSFTYGTAYVYGDVASWAGIVIHDSNKYPTFMANGVAGYCGVYNQGGSVYWCWLDDGTYFNVTKKLVEYTNGYPYVRVTTGGSLNGGNITISTSTPSGTPADGDIWIQRAV